MKAATKRTLIASLCLIAAGAVLTGIGFLSGGRPGISITRNGIETSPKFEAAVLKKTELDSFSDADISTASSADIHILPSGDDHYYLEYRLDKSYGVPTYQVSGNELSIRQPNKGDGAIMTFAFYQDAADQYINLYVPKNKDLGRIKLNNDAGDVTIDSLRINQADITADSGDVRLKNDSLGSLTLAMESGSLTMSHTKAGSLKLRNESGNNTLKDLSCDTAKITLDSGSIYLDAAHIKKLDCSGESGKITVLLPESLVAYTFDVSTDSGGISMPQSAPVGYRKNSDDEKHAYRTKGTGSGLIKLKNDSGNIKIRER